MNYDEAQTYRPSDAEITLELRKHGYTNGAEFRIYCDEYKLEANAPGVLLDFLGY